MQAGDEIAYRYQLVRELQSSWLATDQFSGQSCLLKPLSSFVDPQAAALLERIWHPGLPHLIARVHPGGDHVIDQAEQEYLVFEFRHGRSLREMAAGGNGRIAVKTMLPLFEQAAGILRYLHRQGDCPLMHLDIKPDHLVVGTDGRVSLIDFGAARFYHQAGSAGEAGSAGSFRCLGRRGQADVLAAMTPEFAAPEQMAGCPCPASDIYSLGLTLLHLISGQPAEKCRCRPPHELVPDQEAPAGLLGLIGHCLIADPSLRIKDADELCARLSAESSGSGGMRPEIVPLVLEIPVNQQRNGDQACCQAEKACLQDERQIIPGTESDRCLPAPLICVWGNPEFGCELASVLSETRKVLVIDADLLNPQADLLLGCKMPAISETDGCQLQGLDLALSEERRNRLEVSSLRRMIQPSRTDRVDVLVNGASLDHYEQDGLDGLVKTMGLSRILSECVIILCSRFIYDAFTALCLLASDTVLVPRCGNSGAFRESSRSLHVMTSKQNLDMRKVHFIAFSYKADTDLTKGTLNELCGGRLIGHVSDHGRRRKMKNGAIPYAAAMDRPICNEYKAIIRRLGLTGRRDGRKMKEIS